MKLTKTASQTTLNVTKLDFLKIGFSTGWIKKYSDNGVVEIDGKFYKDEGGVTVEVEKPKEEKSPKSVTLQNITIPAFGIKENFTFTEGELYEIHYGTYQLKNINPTTIDVVYVVSNNPNITVGQTYTYPIIAQAEAILSTKARHQQDMGLQGFLVDPDFTTERKKAEYFVMGYIAQKGYISAEIGPNSIKTFPKKYEQVTGEDVNNYLDKGYHQSPSPRYSYTLRIIIPIPIKQETQSVFNNFSRLDSMITREKGIEINSNQYIWHLFAIGFRIAKNQHNIEKILENIPEEHKEDFIAGTKAN